MSIEKADTGPTGSVTTLNPRLADSDAALVSAALQGDAGATFALWQRYSPLVTRLIRRFFGPGPDHPDVCQEALLRIFTRLRELRDPAAMRGFVASICLGVARNELRRRKIRSIVGLAEPGDLPAPAVEGASEESRETARRLYAILGRLSAEERSLFVTRYIEQMELAEVAAAHTMSMTTTKRRLARMTHRVAAMMQSDPALAELAGRLSARRT